MSALPPDRQAALREELYVIERCVDALSTIETDKVVLTRVMRYLNSRFPSFIKEEEMMVPPSITQDRR